MVRKLANAAVSINLLLWLAASTNLANAAKDQSRIGEDEKLPPSPTSPFSPHQNEDQDEHQGDDQPPASVPFEGTEPIDIAPVTAIELTPDIAKRAIDALAEVRDKYNDQGIDDYETLEDFVSGSEAGKRLEADVKSFGFKDITDWNNSISSVGFAYGALVHNEEEQIRREITDIEQDPQIDAEAKKKMIASLEAMIASDNNKAVVRQLMQDEYYSTRLKLLEEGE